MILPDEVIGTCVGELDRPRNLVCREVLAAVRDELLAGDLRRGLEDDVGLRELALRLVRDSADRGERDCRVGAQDALDLGRIDVEAGGEDHVLHPVDDREVAVLVHRRDVAGVQPAVRLDRRGRALLVAVVAEHHERPAEHQLAALADRHLARRVGDVDDAHRVAGVGDADRAGLVGPDHRVRAGGAGELGHAPDLVDRAAGALGELDRLGRRQRLAADPAARQARQVVGRRSRGARAGSSRRSARRPSASRGARRSRAARSRRRSAGS